MLALYFQQFATRGQKINLLGFSVQLLGKQRDGLDHVLTAIENDKKLSRTNEVDQLEAGILRFKSKSQGCSDSFRNLTLIGEALQLNKMDFPAKLPGSGAANSQGDGRLANTAGAEQCYEPLISKLAADPVYSRFASNHHDRSQGERALVPDPGVPAFPAASERDDGADERVTPPLDVCDVAITKLPVTKCLADRGDVDPDASLLDGDVRPDVIHQLLLCDHFTWALGKVDQDVERPAAEGQYHTVAPEHPLLRQKLEGAKLQTSFNIIVSHGSWPGACLSGVFNYPCAIPARVSDEHELASAVCGELCRKGSSRGDRPRDA